MARSPSHRKEIPDWVGRPIVISLRCLQRRPDERTMRFLNKASAKVARH